MLQFIFKCHNLKVSALCSSQTRCKIYLFLIHLFVAIAIISCEQEIEGAKDLCAKESSDAAYCNSEELTGCASRTSDLIMADHHFVKTLAGIRMPKLIYGTAWKKERTTALVLQAVRAGFRGVDTACQPKHYYEPGVGEALKILNAEDGIPRESLFIQTKFTSIDGQDPKNIPYDHRSPLPETVKQSLQVSLRNLNTTYIDSLVMHSPMRTHRDTMEVWRVFESFVDEGKVRQLGISNCYSLQKFQQIFNEARIKPAVIQNRFYDESGFDKELRQFCKEKGIYYQSFWTLTANPGILSNSKVQEIARTRGKTTPQIFFAYLVQTGVITPLTGTTNLQHMKEDLEALEIVLSQSEMNVIDALVNN